MCTFVFRQAPMNAEICLPIPVMLCKLCLITWANVERFTHTVIQTTERTCDARMATLVHTSEPTKPATHAAAKKRNLQQTL